MGALNNASRTRIGNPWRGTYSLSIAATVNEAERLVEILEELGITAQVNGRQGDSERSARYVAIYDLAGLALLLGAVGERLGEQRRAALDSLVRARGPVPARIRDGIRQRYDVDGYSFAEIAHELNEKRIVDGMGGRGWTASKVESAYRGLNGIGPDAESSHVDPGTQAGEGR
jgi:hypothetical protein